MITFLIVKIAMPFIVSCSIKNDDYYYFINKLLYSFSHCSAILLLIKAGTEIDKIRIYLYLLSIVSYFYLLLLVNILYPSFIGNLDRELNCPRKELSFKTRSKCSDKIKQGQNLYLFSQFEG